MQNQTNHAVLIVHEGPHGHYAECTCKELHPVHWAEGVIPIPDTTIKLCKECKQSYCCNLCRLLGSIH
ncbi:MAG: hypothetical protein WCG55_02110 [bacterium]